MRILGCRISDEDGSLAIEWYEESEQTASGGVTYQSIVTQEAMSEYKHVGYYAKELYGDLEELVTWFEKYRSGRFSD